MRRNKEYLPTSRPGAVNSLYLFAGIVLLVLVGLGWVLVDMGAVQAKRGDELFMYCAAGMRVPIEKIVAEYEREFGIPVRVTYDGSNTLLSAITAHQKGDLYLAADDLYIKQAQDSGLVQEMLPLATMRPVIAVAKGNPKNIQSLDDLFRDGVKTALGNPEQAAVGKMTKKLLTDSGHWEKLEAHVTETGVFEPTVPAVANAVKVGAIDAGVIWDTTAKIFPGLDYVAVPELDPGASDVTLGVLTSSKQPTAALHFARYVAARDKGLPIFSEGGWEVVEGDVWADRPELTFYCGSVNRRAVEPVIEAFQKREGVVVNTVYNGCGILTGQMRTIVDQDQGKGFPDTYMACDVYYLDTVKEMFQDAVNVSDTEVVIAVQKGNPKNITSLQDLTKPGMRVSVGQPKQCTIGVLTKQLLEQEGVYDGVMDNVVTQTTTSALLVPTVATGALDAALAYATDTLAEGDKIDVVRIESPAGKAVQPFSIARSSNQKYLSRRLYTAITQSKDEFEEAGFHWRLDDVTGIEGAERLPGSQGTDFLDTPATISSPK